MGGLDVGSVGGPARALPDGELPRGVLVDVEVLVAHAGEIDPPLTQAQAETLSIVAYLQPVSRPEIARIRGVSSESAVQTLTERGLIEESGRSRFGAVIYRSTPLFERLFGLSGLDDLPEISKFDPTPADEADLRERLLRAGEQRSAP